MKFDDVKDKFGLFFKITAVVFKPYLDLKYNPKPKPTLSDKALSALVYLASWVVIAAVYVFFVYLYIYKDKAGNPGKITDFFEKPPTEIINAFLTSADVAPLFNIIFFVVLYYAVTSFAEKEYLRAIHIHTRLSGLLKVVTLGGFNSSGSVDEQDETQILAARKNVLATISDPEKEAISILAPSGFDMFGYGKAIKKKEKVPTENKAPVAEVKTTEENKNPKEEKKSGLFSRFFQFILGLFSKEKQNLDNGFVLQVVSQKTRNVRIILLNPEGDSAKKRAEDYLGHGSHKPIEKVEDYIDGIKYVIKSIKKIYQTRENRNIELKLIDKLPDWKIVLVEGEVWVQPIIPGMRSDHTPVYGFKKNDHSMYYSYFSIFDELWHHPDSKKVDLSENS